MREGTLTMLEAQYLCNGYADLVGQPFCSEYRNLGNIEAVVICPFGKLDKHYFLKQYQLFNNAADALSFYKGEEFDVVLIGHDSLNQLTCRDLRAHLAYASSQPDMYIVLD